MRTSLAILILALVGLAFAGSDVVTFKPDKNHSRIGFKVRHLGIANVRGSFGEYDATVRFDPADISTLHAEATIEAGSIDTGVERRDNHLRSDDFFNAEEYPTIRFVSKEVRNVNGSEFELVGDLTIRDVTKEIVLEAEYFGVGTQRGRQKAGFEAVGTVNRFDYNLRWDNLTEAGGLVVGESVQLVLELELNEETTTG
ncbi:MAG: YceI family protein [Rhodothermales bacterium]